MKATSIKDIRRLIFTAIFTILASVPIIAQEAKSPEILRDLPGTNPHALVGTWTGQAIITNCSGVTLFNFSKLVSFTESATALETSTGNPPSLRTPALGIWKHEGLNTFLYRLDFYRYNPDNTLAGSTRAIWTVSMNAFNNGYSAEGSIQIIAPNGTVVATLCGTETATRMTFPE